MMNEFEKEALAEEHYNLIRGIARDFKNVPFEYEELFSIAAIGFTKALNTYEPDRVPLTKFTTFATVCMKKEILSFLRKERSAVDNNIKVLSLNAEIFSKKKNESMQIEDVLNYESMINEGVDIFQVETALLKVENRELLEKALSFLPDIEKTVIIIRYGLFECDSHTQSEVAQMIKKSQANISKIENTAKKRLKRILCRMADSCM